MVYLIVVNNLSCGIILPGAPNKGGTIPYGFRLSDPSIFSVSAKNCHFTRVKAGHRKRGHNDSVSQIEGVGLSDQLFASREVLHAFGHSAVRRTRPLVLSCGLVLTGWQPARNSPTVCGRIRCRAQHRRVESVAECGSQGAASRAVPPETNCPRGNGRHLCPFLHGTWSAAGTMVAQAESTGSDRDKRLAVGPGAFSGIESGDNPVFQPAG